MTERAHSYRTILRSSTLTAGASVLNVVISILRMKVAAVLLGPSGVGIIGLLMNFLGMATAVAGTGLANAATRQIAAAAATDDEGRSLGEARSALLWATAVLAAAGFVLTWYFRAAISQRLFNSLISPSQTGWLAVAVALATVASAQSAALNGLRRIGLLSALSVTGAILSTVAGIVALLMFGAKGLIVFVVAAPVASFLVGAVLLRRTRWPSIEPAGAARALPNAIALFRLGLLFMVAGLAMTGAQFVVRTNVEAHLGTHALGYVQAAWTISLVYVGFVLRAMGTDFYPRLSALSSDRDRFRKLVNEQTEIALLLCGPVLLLMFTIAPMVIALLYSSDFLGAVGIFRFQVLGDFLRVASFPLGFAILASGRGLPFLLTESAAAATLVAVAITALPLAGPEAAGMAMSATYLLYLPLVYVVANRLTGTAWNRNVTREFVSVGLALGCVGGLLAVDERWSMAAGSTFAALFAVRGFMRISHLTQSGLMGTAGTFLRRMQSVMGRTP